MIENDLDAFLEHHGIKGQKWGIVNKDPKKGRNPSLRDFSNDQIRSDQLQRKYGQTKDKEDEKFHLTPLQKKIGIGVAVGVGGALLLGGAVYASKQYGVGSPASLINDAEFTSERLKQVAETPMNFYSPGLAAHWKDGVDLPTGSIVQRMSTFKETDIRPSGFFAAFEASDVERYKAELPRWWKTWGYKETSGFLVKLKASSPVKAPTGEQTFELYKRFIDTPEILGQTPAGTAIQRLHLIGEERDKVVSGLAKESFPNFALQWANGYDSHPDVQNFFKIVKKNGFNALIDFNDSGHLAKTPVRFLDGNIFKIAGHEPVSEAAIKVAQAGLKELVMAAIDTVEAFLQHHGIKGQRWGIRNNKNPRPSGVSRSTHREATKDAGEFARAKQFTGVGAGNRRKHIKALVESKKSKSMSYAKAFNAALAAQDVGQHVTKAQKERRSIDRKDRTKKRAGFIARRFTGEMGTQAAFTAAALSGAAFVASPRGQTILKNSVNKITTTVQNERLRRNGAKLISDLFKNQ